MDRREEFDPAFARDKARIDQRAETESARLEGLWTQLTAGEVALDDLPTGDRQVLQPAYDENNRLSELWTQVAAGEVEFDSLPEADRAVLQPTYDESNRLSELWTQVAAGEVAFDSLPEADRQALESPYARWQEDNARHQGFMSEWEELPDPAIGQGSIAQSPEFMDLITRMRASGLYSEEELAEAEASAGQMRGLPPVAGGEGATVDGRGAGFTMSEGPTFSALAQY